MGADILLSDLVQPCVFEILSPLSPCWLPVEHHNLLKCRYALSFFRFIHHGLFSVITISCYFERALRAASFRFRAISTLPPAMSFRRLLFEKCSSYHEILSQCALMRNAKLLQG